MNNVVQNDSANAARSTSQDSALSPLPGFLPAHEQSVAGVADMRKALAQAARDLDAEYERRREELGGFCALNLKVMERNKGRSIQIYWVIYHFRNGHRTGATMVAKPKGATAFDLATLRRAAPDWIHELVTEIELRARPLRETLEDLTSITRCLRSIEKRSGRRRSPESSPAVPDLADTDFTFEDVAE